MVYYALSKTHMSYPENRLSLFGYFVLDKFTYSSILLPCIFS